MGVTRWWIGDEMERKKGSETNTKEAVSYELLGPLDFFSSCDKSRIEEGFLAHRHSN